MEAQSIFKKATATFVLQHDSSDCGVACLLSLIRYYDGESSIESLRELSGTTKTGTTLLGLYQSANQSGFIAEGFDADIDALINHKQPVILHIVHNNMEHYVICYAFDGKEFIIGDPARGIEKWNPVYLESVWKSKGLLTAVPSKHFKFATSIKSAKREWMLALIKDDIGILTISGIIGIIIAVLGMSMAIFSQKLIDVILPNKNLQQLWLGIGLLAFLLCARIGLTALRKHLLLKQERDFNSRIVSLFYDKLLLLPKKFFDNRKIGDLVARLNDTQRIQSTIGLLLNTMVSDVLIVLISTVFLFIYSWQIALIALTAFPLLFFIIYRSNTEITKSQYDVMNGYALSESNFISTIQGVTTIKNFNKQQYFSALNKTIYSFYLTKIFKLGLINLRLGFVSGLCSIAILISILAYGGKLVLDENIKLGELMAVLSICGSILPSITSLAIILIPINEAKVAFNRMFDLINIEHEPNLNRDTPQQNQFNSLNIHNLSFRFPGRPLLLKDLSLNIKKGELVCLVGESACGKSTLSYLISKLHGFESGDIILNNSTSIKNINTDEWRSMIGVAPQDIFIFNGTVLENICLDGGYNLATVIPLLEKYGLNVYFNSLPQGYYTLIGEEGINLSGGQKQIVALARALYKQPQLLILDEITSAMDRNTEQVILNLLLRLKQDMAILFISHRLHILRDISDRIYVMEKGIIVASGNHDELILNEGNLYAQYWKYMTQ